MTFVKPLVVDWKGLKQVGLALQPRTNASAHGTDGTGTKATSETRPGASDDSES